MNSLNRIRYLINNVQINSIRAYFAGVNAQNAFLSDLCKHNLKLSPMQKRFLKSEKKCWKCGANTLTTDLFCTKCNVIQNAPDTRNYFDVFHLQNGFDVNQQELSQKYRQMQNFLHPDRFTNKSDEEKAISDEYSALVNKAYQTLQIPLRRALHLLALNGETIGEDDKATDPQFLADIMELNEELETAEKADAIKALNVKNKLVLDGICEEISLHFRNGDITKAKNCIIKMKYYDSLGTRINELLREKGIVD